MGTRLRRLSAKVITHYDSFFLGRGPPNNVTQALVDTLRCAEKRHGVKFVVQGNNTITRPRFSGRIRRHNLHNGWEGPQAGKA